MSIFSRTLAHHVAAVAPSDQCNAGVPAGNWRWTAQRSWSGGRPRTCDDLDPSAVSRDFQREQLAHQIGCVRDSVISVRHLGITPAPRNPAAGCHVHSSPPVPAQPGITSEALVAGANPDDDQTAGVGPALPLDHSQRFALALEVAVGAARSRRRESLQHHLACRRGGRPKPSGVSSLADGVPASSVSRAITRTTPAPVDAHPVW